MTTIHPEFKKYWEDQGYQVIGTKHNKWIAHDLTGTKPDFHIKNEDLHWLTSPYNLGPSGKDYNYTEAEALQRIKMKAFW